ncbi:TraU family protein [Xanthomonas sacchari]|nr:TraU family protein [Xanthomonas sacchari]
MKCLIRTFILSLLLYVGVASAATADEGLSGTTCPDSGFLGAGFFSNVCWTCIFPIRVAGIPIGPQSGAAAFPDAGKTGGIQLPDIFGRGTSNRVPDGAAGPICVCPGRTFGIPSPGITWGWWEPGDFIEVVRTPWCSPVLGGKTLMDDHGAIGGDDDGNEQTAGMNLIKNIRLGGANHSTNASSENLGQAFYHYHWMKSPYGYVSDWIQSGLCNGNSGGDFDYLWFSEIDPVWTSSKLANLTHPESILFANPIAVTACMADGVLATISKPSNIMFWCAGTWGSIYPHVGQMDYQLSPPRESSLLITRMMAQMHRRGMMQKKFGNDAVCASRYNPILPKQGYRPQMFFPLRETQNNHWIGASTFRWGEWRNRTGYGEDFVYLNFSWMDCCMTLY